MDAAGPGARWELLVGAIAGRRVVVLPGDHERAWCDGERVYTAFDAAQRDSLIVQAALLACGSLDPRIVARLAGRRRRRYRYLTLEAARAGHALRAVMPPSVAQRIARCYDGPISSSASESLQRASSESETIPQAPDWMGTIHPARLLLNGPGLGAALTARQRDAVPDRLEPEQQPEEDDGERAEDGFTLARTNSTLMQRLQRMLGIGTSPSPDEGSAGDLPVGFRAAGRVGEHAQLLGDVPSVELSLGGSAIGKLYPEYHLQAGCYRRDWCAVTEYDPRPAEHEELLELADDRRLRRQLARLGLGHERHRRQEEGDGLDLSALIELVIDRRAGVSREARVYEQQRRTASDLGVLVLLDASGSTGESDGGRTVFGEQRELAARLTAAFDELGVRVASYGFQSWGRNRIEFLRIKAFDDRYDHAVRRRLAALAPGGFTRLGAAIRHATFLLSGRAGTTSTLLVVVGDGLPYDDGYEHGHAHEDCRRALQEAVLAGVGCACVSVRSSTDAAVIERVWGNVPHRSLEGPSGLAAHAVSLFGDALRDAAASRRVLGRDEDPAATAA